MNSTEAARRGWRIATDSSSLVLAELVWRWAFGAGAVGVFLFYSGPIRDALSLSAADQAALFGGSPVQSIQTVLVILYAAFPLLAHALVLAVPKIMLLWILCIGFGRGPVTRQIVLATHNSTVPINARFWLRMFTLQLVRLILFHLLVIGFFGGSFMAGAVSGSAGTPRIALAMLAFVVVFFISMALWSITNFIAALAPVYIVARSRSVLDAISDALYFVRRNRPTLFAIAIGNAGMRTVVAVLITGLGLLLIPLARIAPGILLLAITVFLTLAYCVASDVLLLARFASYSALAFADEQNTEETPISASLDSPLYTTPPDLRS